MGKGRNISQLSARRAKATIIQAPHNASIFLQRVGAPAVVVALSVLLAALHTFA